MFLKGKIKFLDIEKIVKNKKLFSEDSIDEWEFGILHLKLKRCI